MVEITLLTEAQESAYVRLRKRKDKINFILKVLLVCNLFPKSDCEHVQQSFDV
jgi:hypothetical protein